MASHSPSVHPLKDAVILITGASRGIGRSIALSFAAHSPKALILFARSSERLTTVAEEIRHINGSIHTITQAVDISNASAVSEAVTSSLASTGASAISILVNNAGLALGAPRTFGDLSLDEIDSMLGTNVSGYLYVTHAVLNAGKMRAANGGTILNVTSTTALEAPPFPGEAVYHTSKAAQEAFTNVLRNELVGSNIRVLALRPGVVAGTNFHEERVGFEKGKDLYDGFMKGFEPLGPDVVGQAAVWMLGVPESVSFKALDVVPTAQRSLVVLDREWNGRNGKEDVKMGK